MSNPIIQLLKDIKLYGLERMGVYYSSYRAFVIDNEDPEGLGRLILRIPDLTGINIHQKWAWPKGQFSGKGYGQQVIPEKNTLVWATFEFGDPQRPLWEHGYYGKGEKPEELKDIKNFWFKTPQGHIIELDDTKKELRITTANGKTIKEIDGTWLINGGDNGGLVKVESLTTKLNNAESKINDILTALEALGITLPHLTETDRSDIENTNVKH